MPSPKVAIGDSLIGGAANVLHVVPQRAKSLYGYPGDILIKEDTHPLNVGEFDRRYLFLS